MSLGKTIGKINQTSSHTRGQLGNFDGDITLLEASREILEIQDCRVKESSQDIDAGSDFFTYKHSTYGTWGSYYWGSDYDSSFQDNFIYNAHNLFPEGFWNDRFIDSGSSTGSWNQTDEVYFLDGGQYLFTDYIAKEDKVYKSVKVSLNSTFVDSGLSATGSLTIFAVISGSEYSLTNNNTTAISNTSTEGLKLKIVNSAVEAGLTFPLTFPEIFGSASTDNVNISSFTAEYFTS